MQWGKETRTYLKCANCGEDILRHGPEVFHRLSTLIACDPTGVKGKTALRATVGDPIEG